MMTEGRACVMALAYCALAVAAADLLDPELRPFGTDFHKGLFIAAKILGQAGLTPRKADVVPLPGSAVRRAFQPGADAPAANHTWLDALLSDALRVGGERAQLTALQVGLAVACADLAMSQRGHGYTSPK